MIESDDAVIRRFISSQAPGVEVGDDEDIFAAGYVNSLFALQLVLWIERMFDVTVGPRELDIDNFRTVRAITTFVSTKRAGPQRTPSG